MINKMDKVNLKLTPQEIDLIINGLAELPFKTASGLINNLIEQFRAQQNQVAEKTASE